MSDTSASDYDASEITVLEGLEAVRTRPGMYIGGTDSQGLTHLLWELIDNSVDEAAEGHCDKIDITFHKDGSFSVHDNGRGIPVGEHSKGKSALEVIFTELHAGGKFGTSMYAAAGGLHGVGASVVNAMSSRVQVEIDRGGKRHRLDFKDQEPGHWDDKTDKFAPGHALQVLKKVPARQTGTFVRFWPDTAIFNQTATITFKEATDRVRQSAWLLPGVTFRLTDEETGQTFTEMSPNGLEDAIDHLAGSTATIGTTLSFAENHTFPDRVPVKGKIQDVVRDCRVEVSLRWTDEDEPLVVSFVNTIPTPEGGRHVLGFERAVSQEVSSQIKSANLRKLSKVGFNAQKNDCLTGMVAVVRVVIPEPQFEGQTKRRLGTPQAQEKVAETVKRGLNEWFTGKAKNSRSVHVRAVLDHIADAMLTRHKMQQAKEAHRKERKVSGGSLPEKLTDCRTHPGGELLIVEGDSAAGPAKRARDVDWQAILPLRGKIANAQKTTKNAILNNNEAQAFIKALGAGSGRNFDLDAIRYDRIIILADADVDGSHIRALMLTFIWNLMRPMIEDGRVYAAEPPTHAITTLAKNEKKFVYSETELARECKKLDKGNRKYRVTRFKGLGEMDDDELGVTTLNPETRRLRQITADDEELCNEAVQIMMGKDVAPRKEFIVTHSGEYGHALDI